MISMKDLLEEMVRRNASDLHITVGTPPQLRLDGKLIRTPYEVVTPDLAKRLAYSIMAEKQKQKFEEEWEVDLSFGVEGVGRFRTNIFLQRGCTAIAIRRIPARIQNFDELGLPPVVITFANYARGLILITGPTGSGKTTTLAALIDKINSEKHLHILTVEDPIEFVHQHKNALVNQRELYADTMSFARALKYALRQDPDVIMVGEMRDLDTMEAALILAETGHLVFATLHTNSCAETINRIIDVFPTAQQRQVRVQLSFVLQAVVTQQLVSRINGGRVCVTEVMIAIPAIRAQIREDKVHQIYSTLQAGQKYGMRTMNQSLGELYFARKITLDDAFACASDPQELNEIILRKKSTASVRGI